MHFELPDETVKEIEPLREGFDMDSTSWMVPLEKLNALAEGDENLQELLEDLLDQCLRYTKSVVDHLSTLETEGRGEEHAIKDEQRSITHTATQDTIRIFIRNAIKAGKKLEDVSAVLPNAESRNACGQFALRLTLTRANNLETQ
jgi:hypothetical protein